MTLAEQAIAYFPPREGVGVQAVWHTLIYCDLNIEKGRPGNAAATRIRIRAEEFIKHTMKETKGMSHQQIANWLYHYIDQEARKCR